MNERSPGGDSPPPEPTWPDLVPSGYDEEREYDLSCTVDPYRDGWRLDEFLSHRFRYHPPHVWAERLAEERVRVNGRVGRAETTLGKGDRIDYAFRHAEPSVDFRHEVLFEDDEVLAVAKSGNLPVHAGGKFIRNTLIARLRESRDDSLRLVHRLDRETSGVVLLAKSAEVARELGDEFRHHAVEKEYVAVVRGRLEARTQVDGPIARRQPAEPPYFRVVAEGGKPAVTEFVPRTAGRVRGREATLVTVIPREGRTNQIRVHAAHVGHPLVGDKIYGVAPELARRFVDEGEFPELLREAGAARHLLHCARLKCSRGEFVAPLPPEFALEP